jgi:hypothetical protein
MATQPGKSSIVKAATSIELIFVGWWTLRRCLMEYLVEWDIVVEADSPEEAAKIAFESMKNPGSTDLIFVVSDEERSYLFDFEGK